MVGGMSFNCLAIGYTRIWLGPRQYSLKRGVSEAQLACTRMSNLERF